MELVDIDLEDIEQRLVAHLSKVEHLEGNFEVIEQHWVVDNLH